MPAPRMTDRARRAALAAALLWALPASAEPLVLLARPGPWPAVSGLVGYGERLWFANSALFEDHNAADVYSYDPATGKVRFEANLFSQGPGTPVVAGGLLYWPFEDARASTGRGEFMLTDGRRWRWHVLPEGQVFHVHAMAALGGALYAATSAWRAGIQRSDDGGRRWRIVYEHPSAPRTVSRFTELAELDERLYAGLSAWRQDGIKLWRVGADGAAPVGAWPEGENGRAIIPH